MMNARLARGGKAVTRMTIMIDAGCGGSLLLPQYTQVTLLCPPPAATAAAQPIYDKVQAAPLRRVQWAG